MDPSTEPGETQPVATRRLGPSMGLWARLRAYFVAGLLVTAPVAFTIYVAWLFISFIDEQVTTVLPSRFNPETYLPFSVPGLGVVIVLIFLILVGSMAAGFVGRLFVRTSDAVLAQIPAVRSVYTATKQILQTVLAKQSTAFREVVLIEYPRDGIWVLGFITGITETTGATAAGDQLVNVFVPTTPNPTSGFLLFVPRREIIVLPMTIEDGVKMVVSGGLVAPPEKPPEPPPARG